MASMGRTKLHANHICLQVGSNQFVVQSRARSEPYRVTQCGGRKLCDSQMAHEDLVRDDHSLR